MPRSFLVRKCGTAVRHRSAQLVEELRITADERQYVEDFDSCWQSTTTALEYHRADTTPVVELGVQTQPARQHFAFTQLSDGTCDNRYSSVLFRAHVVLSKLSTIL